MATLAAPMLSQGQPLEGDWTFVSLKPGVASSVAELMALDLPWAAALVPGTVASARRALGDCEVGDCVEAPDLDTLDHWYRCALTLPALERVQLCFDGLATLAQVFWNETLVLQSDNMFVRHEVDLSDLPRRGSLWIRFQALSAALAVRRVRPRWRTRLVAQQQMRWIRTALVGRIPAWLPMVAPVGPFRPVSLITSADAVLRDLVLRTTYQGGTGCVELQANLQLPTGFALTALSLQVGAASVSVLPSEVQSGRCAIAAHLTLPEVSPWWPHTHGEPCLYPASLVLEGDEKEAGRTITLSLGPLGFRALEVVQEAGSFQVKINHQPVFCRGACWTPLDVVSLGTDEAALRTTLSLVRGAGMNMIRMGGTMVYESNAFYRLCDEMGILVWQDFMFANMDYPVADPAFAASIEAEARQFLQRIQSRAGVVVLCGGSEVEQQAAMLGLSPDQWRNDFFGRTLPALCAEVCPHARYVPSSPSGGAMPFQVDQSVSHYYGVGAYLRPLDDARRAGVRFTSECLGFSNVPEEATIETFMGNGQQPFHHPVWKQGVPRDGGAGWDFEDVRDHYLAELFKLDPMRLRYADMPRYLSLSRVVTGEVMARTMLEWRRQASSCQGALVWYLRDMWLGAGWGVIDALGVPKAAYFALKRALSPLAVAISDEGLNGLAIHVFNDGPKDLSGTLALRLLRGDGEQVAQAHQPVQVAAHGSVEIRADAMLAHFADTSYAYRFGPPGHHAAVATLTVADGVHAGSEAVRQAFHFPLGLDAGTVSDLGLRADFSQTPQGAWSMLVSTRQLAQFVHLEIPGYLPSDNYFHLAPGAVHSIDLVGNLSAAPKGEVTALNGQGRVKIGRPVLTPLSP